MRAALLLLLLLPQVGYAAQDSYIGDTAIYGGATVTLKPNVLIIFDTSGSMGSTVPVETCQADSDNDGIPDTVEADLDVLADGGIDEVDAVAVLTAIIRGDTTHYDHIAAEVSGPVATITQPSHPRSICSSRTAAGCRSPGCRCANKYPWISRISPPMTWS